MWIKLSKISYFTYNFSNKPIQRARGVQLWNLSTLFFFIMKPVDLLDLYQSCFYHFQYCSNMPWSLLSMIQLSSIFGHGVNNIKILVIKALWNFYIFFFIMQSWQTGFETLHCPKMFFFLLIVHISITEHEAPVK